MEKRKKRMIDVTIHVSIVDDVLMNVDDVLRTVFPCL